MANITNQEFPKFISSFPTGDDIFEGKSQEKISTTIFNLIENKSLPNNVIGLEGKWGSGKSNVIENLRKKFKSSDLDYDFFTYDAWGHQEDLTRKTFLEELIFQLKESQRFNENIDWEEELKKLLAKKSTKNTYKFPKIKFYWILITASILLFTFLDIVHTDFLSSFDILKEYNNSMLKLFLIKYLIPSGIFIWGIIEFIKEYIELGKNEKTRLLKWREKIKRLFYVFSGSDIESEELENVLEENPSVRQFKIYFDKIIKDLKSDGLIIVFDNMDRLSQSEKVLSLWSSIYTFFTEEKKSNVWVIIPYDKEHLSNHFGGNQNDKDSKTDNFIGKAFSTSFRISPPVLSDWKRFFNLKFKEAFGTLHNDEEIDFISSLYETVLDLKNRNPRDIISYINNLVSLTLQHNSLLNIKYLALFLLRKKEILENPLTAIASKSFMIEESYLFNDEKELEQSMASIVYNVDKEKANEVLLKNNIEDMFLRPDLDAIKQIKKHSDFKTYFDNVIRKSDFSKFQPQNTTAVLEEIKDVVSIVTLKGYWEKFGNNLNGRPKEEFVGFKEWHKKLLINVSELTRLKFSNSIIDLNRISFSEKKRITEYYVAIHDLLEFIKDNSLAVKPDVTEVYFSPTDFISYIDDFSYFTKIVSLQEMNIITNSKELNDYFIQQDSKLIKEVSDWLHCIEYLIKNETQRYKFDELSKKVEEQLPNVVFNNKEDISMILKIMKVLNGYKKLKPFDLNFLDSYLNTYGNEKEDIYFDLISCYISLIATSNPRNQVLLNELNKTDSSDKIAERIQYYIGYGDLLKTIIDKERNYPLLNEVVKKLTVNSFGFSRKLEIDWVYENIGKIKDKIFIEDIEIFLTSFDSWQKGFPEKIKDENVLKIGESLLNLTCELGIDKFKSLKHYHETVIRKLKSIDEETWLADFSNPSIILNTLEGFLSHNLILDTSITKSAVFMGAYELYFKSIAKRDTSIPNNKDFWNSLLKNDYLDNRRLKRIYNDILDLLLNHSEVEISEVKFFSFGIFTYASNISDSHKADEVIRKFILPPNNINELSGGFTSDIVSVINSASTLYYQELYEYFVKTKEIAPSSSIDFIISNTKLKDIEIN
jgi:hypothetical protein